jgi:deoxyadenosine/deoxycytidine kinase
MGKIISVVGNLGAGKTTLTKLLSDTGLFVPYWENPEEHPFQAAFTGDIKRWALVNQLDFLLFRCKQEYTARNRTEIAIMDGGFDQDFHVFTKNLQNKGLLTQGEFNLCRSFYGYVRNILPPPDLLIRIVLDTPVLMKRRSARGRKTVDEKFDQQVFTDLERLLVDWLNSEVAIPIIHFSFDQDIHYYTEKLDGLVEQINSILLPGNNINT